MEENSVRLVTQYDVYATMVDILKVSVLYVSKRKLKNKGGLS